MADTINIIVNGTDNASGVLRSVAGGLDSVASSAANFGARFGATVSAPVIAVGALGVAFNATREQAEVAFTTMLGSGEAARDFLDDLAQFAARTPFEFTGITQASQKLMAMGFEAEQVIPMMTAVGDAVAALGGGQFEIDRVVRALGQMEARGKTSAQEMLQLTEVGIPAWQMLADAIGVSVPEAMDLVSKGAIDSTTTINAVLGGMSAQFGGMMEQQSQTWNGVMSTIKDTVMMTLGTILLPLFNQAKVMLLDFANNVLPQIQAWFLALPEPMRNAGLALGLVLAAAGPLALGLAAVTTALGALLSPIGLVVVAVGALAVAWTTNFGGIRDATAQAVGFVTTAVQNIRSRLTDASEAPAIFAQAFERAKETAQGALAALRSIVDGVLGAIRQFVATHGADIQQTLSNAWTQVARIVELAVQIVQATVVPIFRAIAQFIREHGQEIQTVLSAAWTIIKNVIQGALTLIEGIFKAVLAALKGDWRGAWEIIKDTVDRVWDNIVAILEAATALLVTVIGTALATIYDWVVEKFEAIKGYLRGISLADIGRAIIQGLVDGIRSMAGALVSAAQGVVQSAIDAAKNLLGMHSPSRVFMEIGEGTMEGFLLGILGMGQDVLGAVIEVLGAVEEEAAEQAANIAGAMETVLGTLVAAIEAVNTLATATLPEVSIGGTVDRIILLLTDIVTRFLAAAGQFEDEGIEAAKRLAEAGGAIVGELKSMIDGFDAVANYRPQVIGPTLNRLFDQMRGTIIKLVRIAPEFDGPGLTAATTLATAGGAMVGQLKAMVDGFDAVAAYKPEVIGPTLNTLFDQMRGTIVKLVALAPEFDGPGLAAATQLAQAGGAIASQLKSMVDGLMAVATYSAQVGLADAVDALAADLEALVQTMAARFGSLDEDTLAAYDAAAAFGQRIGGIVGVISPGVTAIKALAGYVTTANIAAAVQAFTADILVVAEELRQALSGATDETLAAYDAARAFAERISGVFQAIRPGMDLLRELSRYGGPSNIHSGMQTFLRHIEGVMNTLGTTMQTLSPTTVADAVAFSEAARLMVENVRAAMTAASGLTNAYDGAFDVAQSWMDGLVDGLRSRLDDLTALMAYIRGLFPSSPAEHGPWRDLPQGQAVAQGWLGGMTAALNRTGDLAGALGGVRGMFGGPGLQPAYAGAGVQVTINVQGAVIREDADIEKLANRVGDVIARQAGYSRRLGLTRA